MRVEWAGLTSILESNACTNRPASMCCTHTRLLEYHRISLSLQKIQFALMTLAVTTSTALETLLSEAWTEKERSEY